MHSEPSRTWIWSGRASTRESAAKGEATAAAQKRRSFSFPNALVRTYAFAGRVCIIHIAVTFAVSLLFVCALVD